MATLWVIDDQFAVAESLTMLFECDGILSEAISADAALDRFREGKLPSGLVLDLNMPGISGTDLLREIASHDDWTFPVIVLSGYADELPRELKSRVYATLTKAVDPGDLLRIVKEVV